MLLRLLLLVNSIDRDHELYLNAEEFVVAGPFNKAILLLLLWLQAIIARHRPTTGQWTWDGTGRGAKGAPVIISIMDRHHNTIPICRSRTRGARDQRCLVELQLDGAAQLLNGTNGALWT